MFETDKGEVVAVNMKANKAEVNDGRGWPGADEPAPVDMAPHRILLFRMIKRALRSEHGVRMRQSQGKKTDYYAGRRAGAICDAADLMAVLYGGDYDAAKTALSMGVRTAGEAVPTEDLILDDTSEALARTIAEKALRVI